MCLFCPRQTLLIRSQNIVLIPISKIKNFNFTCFKFLNNEFKYQYLDFKFNICLYIYININDTILKKKPLMLLIIIVKYLCVTFFLFLCLSLKYFVKISEWVSMSLIRSSFEFYDRSLIHDVLNFDLINN